MNPGETHKTRTLLLCGVLHAFTHVYQVALLPLYLPIQKDFKLASVGQATLLMTVMMAAYFLPSYGMGILADRISRKKLLTAGLVINGTGFVGLSFAPNYPSALACIMVSGIGGSTFHPAATAMIARLFPINTGRALGLLGMGASVGFFVSPIYAGWRAEMSGWRTPVLELGLLGVTAAGVFAWLADEEPAARESGGARSTHTGLFPTTTLWVFFFAAAALFSLRDFAGSSMGSLGSLFMQKAHGFSLRQTGAALSAIFLAGVISNPLFGHLSDRGRIRWTAAVLLMSVVIVAVFPRMAPEWLLPTFALYGFFFMASYPMVEAALMQSVPDAVRGRVFGLFITVGGLLGNLSHWIMGNWVKGLGTNAINPAAYCPLYLFVSLMLLASLLGLPCLHAIRKREHLDQSLGPVPGSAPSIADSQFK
jgi:FSR family fosmidomycin resistance protein-like MFS transporter